MFFCQNKTVSRILVLSILMIIISTLFTVGFDLVEETTKYQLRKLPSKDDKSTKYLKGNYL